MRVVGIIAEYNPLHNGHIYHLEQAKQQSGASFCIVAMSGNFVQRGEPACTDKQTRAEWAIRAGADLVVELPSVYAVSSAERFAIGGIKTLAATGVVTDLAFGCEETDFTCLEKLCNILDEEPTMYTRALREHLKLGKSYARARYDALKDYGVSHEMLGAVAQPNNILGIEYLKALRSFAPHIRPLPIARIGSDYNKTELEGEYSSATAIRKALSEGRREGLSAMPSFVGGPLLFDRQFLITQEAIGDMILYAIRRMSLDQLREIPDVAEGLENVLYRAARSANAIETFYDAVKSKRYTLARCKRIAISALLGIDNDHVHRTVISKDSSYLKVLALNKNARPLLSEISRAASAPFIMRYADTAAASDIAQRNLEIDSLSTDILAYAMRRDVRRDFTAPVIL